MKCEFSYECKDEAIAICFCPTWINTKQKEAGTLAFGPRPNTTINRMPANVHHLCLEHAKNFIPRYNPEGASNSEFYWCEKALTKHAEHLALYKEGKNII